MTGTRSSRAAEAAGAVLLATLAAGCAGNLPPFPLPDEPGLYALGPDDELVRLDSDGDSEWEEETWPERSALSSSTEFVIYDPSLEQDLRPRDRMATLWRVAWVRSEIDSSGLAGPITGSEWALAPIAPLNVATTAASPSDYPQYIHVVPLQPLAPGLYALRLTNNGSDRTGRLGVDWEGLDRRTYAARHCVDRLEGRVQGGEPGYRLCTTQDVVARSTTDGLDIRHVEPLRRGDTFVVEGMVVNTTSEPKAVPLLLAVLRDSAGRSVSQAVIKPDRTDLQPGERTRFRTEIAGAPPATAAVDVDFMPTGDAGM